MLQNYPSVLNSIGTPFQSVFLNDHCQVFVKAEIIINDLGFLIKSNNLYTSVGWRNKNEKIWNIYNTNQLINPKDDFEVVLFRPGYEVLVQVFKK